MDQTTTDVRLANWKSIVEQCSARPDGISAGNGSPRTTFRKSNTTTGSEEYERTQFRRLRLLCFHPPLGKKPRFLLPRYHFPHRHRHLPVPLLTRFRIFILKQSSGEAILLSV
jgi:hypothetical protein